METNDFRIQYYIDDNFIDGSTNYPRYYNSNLRQLFQLFHTDELYKFFDFIKKIYLYETECETILSSVNKLVNTVESSRKKIIKSLNHDNSDVKVLTEDLNLTNASLIEFIPKCKVELYSDGLINYDKEILSYVDYGGSYTVNATINTNGYDITGVDVYHYNKETGRIDQYIGNNMTISSDKKSINVEIPLIRMDAIIRISYRSNAPI